MALPSHQLVGKVQNRVFPVSIVARGPVPDSSGSSRGSSTSTLKNRATEASFLNLMTLGSCIYKMEMTAAPVSYCSSEANLWKAPGT